MAKQEKCVALARFQGEDVQSRAFLMSRTSSRHGRAVHGYRWIDESGRSLDGMSRGHAAARMFDAARRDRRFTGIVLLGAED